MKEDQLQQIRSIGWGQLYQKLEAFSLSLAKLYFKRKFRNLPKGYTYEDVVQKAIRRALEKDWEAIDIATFENFLFGAVKSIYWGLVISADNNKTVPLTAMDDTENDERDHSVNASKKDLAETNVDLDYEIDFKEIMKLIDIEISRKRNSVELRQVFEGVKIGLEPRQISSQTGYPLEKVTNCKRQLLRIIENLSKTLSDA